MNVWLSIELAAAKLDLHPQALRARCRRVARKEGNETYAKLGMGVFARKLGNSWRVFVPDAESDFPPYFVGAPVGTYRTYPGSVEVLETPSDPLKKAPRAKSVSVWRWWLHPNEFKARMRPCPICHAREFQPCARPSGSMSRAHAERSKNPQTVLPSSEGLRGFFEVTGR